jgi:hypothetical protein
MSIDIAVYLKAKGFHAHPFATTNAEQEHELLASYFVHVAWFDRLLGQTRQPESMILFAPRGHGKTSHRVEIARRAATSRDAQALVVTVTDFDMLASATTGKEILAAYLVYLRRVILENLDNALHKNPRQEELFQQDERSFLQFCALLDLYARRHSLKRGKLSAKTKEIACAYKETELSIKEWFHEISQLAQRAGFASIYILIDGIDEQPDVRNDPTRAVQLLSPLLESPGLLQELNIAFKFFLPDNLEEPMRNFDAARLDRIPVYHLVWSDYDLHNMLSRRLASFSLISETRQIGYVNYFRDLCDSNIDGDALLVEAAKSSPRQLIDLARRVLEEHCRVAPHPNLLIEGGTIHKVLTHRDILLPLATSTGSSAPRPIQFVPAVPEQSQDGKLAMLFFDQHNNVWIGDVCQTHNRPLPRLLLVCMTYFWQHRHRAISYDELQQALYGDDLDDRLSPRSSCDKIVRRLRAVLEPGKASSQNYIAVQPGTGYTLRNCRETH